MFKKIGKLFFTYLLEVIREKKLIFLHVSVVEAGSNFLKTSFKMMN